MARAILGLMLLLVAVPARAAERPSLAFLGVYDATGNDARSHRLEQLFTDELARATSFGVKLPAELDAGGLGRSSRQDLLNSRAPELRLAPYRTFLGDYLLVVRIAPDTKSLRDSDVATVRLLQVAKGTECFSKELPGIDGPSVAGVVGDLNRLVGAAAASPRAEVVTSNGVRLTHTPVETAPPNVPAVLEAEVESQSTIFVSAFYRRTSDARWQTLDLVHLSGHRYVGSLPPLPEGDYQYYLHVTDQELNELASIGSAEKPRLLTVTPAAAASSEVPAGVIAAPTTRPETPASPWSWQRKLGLGAALAGAAVLLSGTGLGVAVSQRESQIKTGHQPGAVALQNINSVNSQAAAANALMISGGVIAAGGAGLVILF